MDGQFDTNPVLQASGTALTVGGPLRNAQGLAVKVDVVVAQDGVQAQGTGDNVPTGDAWSGNIAVLNGAALKAGPAIAYATAVAMENGGISTYQWHGFLDLKES